MQVPSGRVFDDLDLQIMRLSAVYNFVKTSAEPFTFKSGAKSNVYVSGRDDLTDHPDLEWVVGRKIANLILQNALERNDLKQQCLIGLPTAGTALAQAAAMVNWSCQRLFGANEDPRIIHRVMRETLKTHGAHPDWVNGKAQPGSHTYWSVDNVATDGGTKLEARERFRESDYPVETMPAFIWIDRQQGAITRLKLAGFSVIVVAYKLLDVTFALGELGFWPKETVKSVEVEIRAHQLIK